MSATGTTTAASSSSGKHRPANLRSSFTGPVSSVASPTSPSRAIQPLSAASTGSIDFFPSSSSSAASFCSSDDLGIVSMSEADGSSSDNDASGPRSSSALSATSWSDLDSPTSQSPGVLTSEPNSPVRMAGSVSKAVAVRLSPLPSPAIVATASATTATSTRDVDNKTLTHISAASTNDGHDEHQPSTLAWGLAKVVNLVTLSLLDPAIDPWVSDAPFNGDSVGYHSPRAPATTSVAGKHRNTNNLPLSTPKQDDDQHQAQQQHVPSLSLAATLNGSHASTGDGSVSPLNLIDEDSPYLSSPTTPSDDKHADGSGGGGFFKTLLSPISSRFRSWLTDTSDDDDDDDTDTSTHHDDMTTPAYEGADPFAFSDFAARHHHHHRSDSYTLYDSSSPLASPVASSSDAMDTLGMRLFASGGGGSGADEAGTDGAYLRRWTPSPTVF